jgi:hypothetical protein
MRFSWEKLGKFLAGGIAAIAAIAAAYTALVARPASLTAWLTYDYQNYPQQFVERLATANAKFQYRTLYGKISSLGGGSLDHEKVDAITKYAMTSHFSMFDGLFENGLRQDGTKLFLYIDNTSSKVAKDIIVNLPESALVLVQDETGTYSAPETLLRSVKLGAIAPSNHAKIWAYFSTDMKAVEGGVVRISHADGVADMYVNETFNGIDARVARNSSLILFICGALFVLVAACFSLLVFSSNEP